MQNNCACKKHGMCCLERSSVEGKNYQVNALPSQLAGPSYNCFFPSLEYIGFNTVTIRQRNCNNRHFQLDKTCKIILTAKLVTIQKNFVLNVIVLA